MRKVGLTGGYATGKSFVAAQLEQLGCRVISADQLGHAVLLPGGEAYQPAVDAFGDAILAPDGTIDRRKLASIVFEAPDLLAELNRFVHPAVFRMESAMLQEFSGTDPDGIAVVEAAILIETGRYRDFEHLVVTICNEETQIARGMRRDGLTRAEVLARLARQLPALEKTRFADYVVDTGGPKEETIRHVRNVYDSLRGHAGP